MAEVGRIASGYVYYVSLKGVTGAGHLDTAAVAAVLPRIRAHVKVPVGVGFGIRDAATARAVAEVADAVVIGSRAGAAARRRVARECRGGGGPLHRRHPRRARRLVQRGSNVMSWLEKLLPPKIQPTDPNGRRTVPEGLWVKCPSCETVLYKTDLEQNVNVCPKCGHHHRIGARARLDAFLDAEGRYEIGQEVLPVDALKFKDSKKYPERLKDALETTGETDALVVFGGMVHGIPLVAACFEFDFMGGSMGSVVGERFVRGVETAVDQRTPFISFSSTGGARMQEGLLSLMQMAKTNAALTRLAQGRAALRQRARRPDDGRRVGVVRLHGRRGHRRAEGADRLRRSARDREHRAREAARGLPARRVPAPEGRRRHDRRPPRARSSSPGCSPCCCARTPTRSSSEARGAGAARSPPFVPPRGSRRRAPARRPARAGRAPARRPPPCLHPMPPTTLDDWLAHCERLHPQTIDLTLDRALAMRERLGLAFDAPLVVVGGTNGKGSTCAMLEAIALRAGWRVGLHTRRTWCASRSAAASTGRRSRPTSCCRTSRRWKPPAATWRSPSSSSRCSSSRGCSPGARSISSCSRSASAAASTRSTPSTPTAPSSPASTSTMPPGSATRREAIGFEKAGIFRPGRPAIVSDPLPPQSLVDHAEAIGADLWLAGRDFRHAGDRQQWNWAGRRQRYAGLAYPALRGANQLLNASGALAAFEALRPRLPVSAQAVRGGLAAVELPGRFQIVPGQPTLVLDVAHNPHAVATLAQNLDQMGFHPRTHAVFGAMRDKDIAAMVARMAPLVDIWHVTDLPTPRAAGADELAAVCGAAAAAQPVLPGLPPRAVHRHADPAAALAAAVAGADPPDRIVVFGSFHTVGGVLLHGVPRMPAPHLS